MKQDQSPGPPAFYILMFRLIHTVIVSNLVVVEQIIPGRYIVRLCRAYRDQNGSYYTADKVTWFHNKHL